MGLPCREAIDCAHPTLPSDCASLGFVDDPGAGICVPLGCQIDRDCGPGGICGIQNPSGQLGCVAQCGSDSDCAGNGIGCVGGPQFGVSFCFGDCRQVPPGYCEEYMLSCDQGSGLCL